MDDLSTFSVEDDEEDLGHLGGRFFLEEEALEVDEVSEPSSEDEGPGDSTDPTMNRRIRSYRKHSRLTLPHGPGHVKLSSGFIINFSSPQYQPRVRALLNGRELNLAQAGVIRIRRRSTRPLRDYELEENLNCAPAPLLPLTLPPPPAIATNINSLKIPQPVSMSTLPPPPPKIQNFVSAATATKKDKLLWELFEDFPLPSLSSLPLRPPPQKTRDRLPPHSFLKVHQFPPFERRRKSRISSISQIHQRLSSTPLC